MRPQFIGSSNDICHPCTNSPYPNPQKMKGLKMKNTVYKNDLERKFIQGNFPYQPFGTLFDYEGSGRNINPDVLLTRESLLEMYFDYVNNYLTMEKFAEHRGLYVYEAAVLIDLAKRCLASPHPES